MAERAPSTALGTGPSTAPFGGLRGDLRRTRNPMPSDIAALLAARGLEAAYDERPPYQRNDYLGWIARAKRPETRRRRLEQMLTELEGGTLYMGMSWRTGRPVRAASTSDGPRRRGGD